MTTPDPVQKAIDDYLLMERKARAWEKLRMLATMRSRDWPELLDVMHDLVHPAQHPST